MSRVLVLVAVASLVIAGVARADLAMPTQSGARGTFCEFEVFHADTHKPMSGIRYRLTLPSGEVKKGSVPKSGIVHYDVPRAGTCTIDLDLPPGLHVVDEKSR